MKADELGRWIIKAKEEYNILKPEFGKLGINISFDTYLILRKEWLYNHWGIINEPTTHQN